MQCPPTERLERQLEAYSATSESIASSNWRDRMGSWPLYAAATASALACSTSASASILYSGPLNFSLSVTASNPSVFRNLSASILKLTLSHSSGSGAIRRGFASIQGLYAFNFLATGTYIKRFASGSAISSHAAPAFVTHGILWGNSYGSQFGNWGPANQTGFAGLAISPSSTTGGYRPVDFGWLRFSVKDLNSDGYPDQITLIDAALNDVPFQSINAGEGTPEPATKAMMLLAAGFGGVLAWRRRRAAAA